jgi:hypothetical protein
VAQAQAQAQAVAQAQAQAVAQAVAQAQFKGKSYKNSPNAFKPFHLMIQKPHFYIFSPFQSQ